MPSLKSAVSGTWFFRIDGESDILRPKVLAFAQGIDVISCLGTFHTGSKKENPHCHIVVQMATQVQKQSYALRIKKHFEVVDRGYALDVWDGKRAEYGASSYLFHEENAPILVSKLWEQTEIQEAQRIAKITNEAVAIAKKKAGTTFVDRALEHFKDKEPSKYQIFEYLMFLTSTREIYWTGYKTKSMVEEVEIKLSKNIGHLTAMYYNSIFRD